MQSSNMSLIARLAQPSDHDLVARLCRRAVGPGDYVLRILRETIAEKGLFLAWSEGKLVGITNFEKCIDGSGWLSMGRTDPEWRRRGIALFLQQRIRVHARRRGIGYLRLWILSNNRPSLLTAMKGGFRPVCEAAHVSSSTQVRQNAEQPHLHSLTSSESLTSLLSSAYLSKMNGYFGYKWHFVKASEKLLKRLGEKGELYSDGERSFILTKPEMAFDRYYSSFTLLDGSARSNLLQVKNVAKYYSGLRLGSYLPYERYVLSLALRAGFKRDSWGKHCIVFEKKI